MHDLLFESQLLFRAEDLLPFVEQSSVDLKDIRAFEVCLIAQETTERIEKEMALARKLGLTGTPGFALGTTDGQGDILVQLLIQGARPLEVFEEAIAELEKPL